MKKTIETKASSVELAVEQALEELGTTLDRVEVEVLSKGGIFSKAQVRVSIIESLAEKTEQFINGILERMGLSSRARVEEADNVLNIDIEGEDSGVAIGYRGEALDAIQYLALTFINQEKSEFKKVVVDSENYREKRRETLTSLAYRLAEKAHRSCRKVTLEPMNPFERRIIHSALADSELAETTSEGEEPNRYVVIIPKGVEIREDRRRGPRTDGRRNGREGFRDSGRGGRPRQDNRVFRDGGGGDRRQRPEVEEVEDGREFRGYYTAADDFQKPAEKKQGPPKFKSFGGQKKF